MQNFEKEEKKRFEEKIFTREESNKKLSKKSISLEWRLKTKKENL